MSVSRFVVLFTFMYVCVYVCVCVLQIQQGGGCPLVGLSVLAAITCTDHPSTAAAVNSGEISIVPLRTAGVRELRECAGRYVLQSSLPPPLDSLHSTTSPRTLFELPARQVGRFPPLLHIERLSKPLRISGFYSETHLS